MIIYLFNEEARVYTDSAGKVGPVFILILPGK